MDRFGQKEGHHKDEQGERHKPRQEVHLHFVREQPDVRDQRREKVADHRPQPRHEAPDGRGEQFSRVGESVARRVTPHDANQHFGLGNMEVSTCKHDSDRVHGVPQKEVGGPEDSRGQDQQDRGNQEVQEPSR